MELLDCPVDCPEDRAREGAVVTDVRALVQGLSAIPHVRDAGLSSSEPLDPTGDY